MRSEGDDAQLDLIAARLLVVGDGLAQRHILVLDEALREPHGRGGRRRPGDMGCRKGASCGESQGSMQHRTPGEVGHSRLLPVSRLGRALEPPIYRLMRGTTSY